MDRKLNYFTRLILRILEKLQEITIRMSNSYLYYYLVLLSFRLYWGKDLIKCVEEDPNCEELEAAALSHACTVLNTIYEHELDWNKRKILFNCAKNSFIKNILGETKLEVSKK